MAPTPPQSSAEKDSAAGESTAPNPYADIVALSREMGSKPQFMAKVLRYATQFFKSPYAALHVRYASEVIEDDYHSGTADPKFWKSSLQNFLTGSLGANRPRAKLLKAKTGDTKVAFISVPIFDRSGSSIGSMAFVVTPIDDGDLPNRLVTLDAMTSLASACTEFLGEGRTGEGPGDHGTSAAGDRAPTAALRGPACLH